MVEPTPSERSRAQHDAPDAPPARHCQFALAPPRHFIYPAILLLLAEKPRHGYRLVDPLLQLGFGSTMDRPSVYRALGELHRDGLLETWSAASTAGGARHMYAVTTDGLAVLKEWVGVIAAEDDCLRTVLRRYASLVGEVAPAAPEHNGVAPAPSANGTAPAPSANGAVPPADDHDVDITTPPPREAARAAAAPPGPAKGDPMHEISIASSIADAVRRHAGVAPVERVRIEVGHLRQVVPDTLVFCWEMVTDGTDLEGSELEVTEVPATIECQDCHHSQTLDAPLFLCEVCGSTSVTVTSGEELLIRSYDLTEA